MIWSWASAYAEAGLGQPPLRIRLGALAACGGGLRDDHSALELGYKVVGESLTINRRIQRGFGPPRVPSSLALAPRQEPRGTLIGGATLYPQSR